MAPGTPIDLHNEDGGTKRVIFERVEGDHAVAFGIKPGVEYAIHLDTGKVRMGAWIVGGLYEVEPGTGRLGDTRWHLALLGLPAVGDALMVQHALSGDLVQVQVVDVEESRELVRVLAPAVDHCVGTRWRVTSETLAALRELARRAA
jgi:hypothetical protein